MSTDRGLPSDADIPGLIQHGDERELLAVWETYWTRRTWETVADHARARYDHEQEQDAVGMMKELAEVSDLQALAANHRLVGLLTGRRWVVMQNARENGASWAKIGAAVNLSEQEAKDWYQQKIDAQAQHLPEFHDADVPAPH